MGIADGEDVGFDLLVHLYALCFARLAAAHGDFAAINLAAHLSAALSEMVAPTILGPRRPGFQADAMALFDVAADRAPPEQFDAMENRLREMSDASEPYAHAITKEARTFWAQVLQPIGDA
ncbi:hypothetical protein BWQ93_01600 [Sphingopyxis sp. QXT-31]|nr:hypothetical protein BWQ93_01600 [Sphingopyxis sp. QXT-31]